MDYIQENYLSDQSNRWVRFYVVWFGSRTIQLYNYMVCLLFCICWKNAKWIEIREVTKEISDKSFVTRFFKYFKLRQLKDDLDLMKKALVSKGSKSDIGKQLNKIAKQQEKAQKKQKKKAKKTADIQSRLSESSSERSIETYLPEIVLNTARILLTLMAYTYHSETGLINIGWVIISMLFTERLTFIFSIFVMLPILFLQFVLIYGGRIPLIKEKPFFVEYAGDFQWEMYLPTLEQSLMFLVIICFCMMIACVQIIDQ